MDGKLKCYILGKDEFAIDMLSGFISRAPEFSLAGVCFEASDVLTSGSSIQVLADVVFIDLDNNGMAEILHRYNPGCFKCVVFYGSSKNLAAEIFDLGTVDYLLMPCTYERFSQCIDRVNGKLERTVPIPCVPSPCFFIQTEVKGKFVRINKQEIVYAEGALNYIQIHLEGKSYSAYLTIREMEDTLCSPQFVRVHRSFIINMDKVTGVEGNTVFLSGNTRVVLGPSYREGFFERLNALLVRSKRLG